jgi:hypothetical protein
MIKTTEMDENRDIWKGTTNCITQGATDLLIRDQVLTK